MSAPWYQNWFGKTYRDLYQHRSREQAQVQVAFLLRHTKLRQGSPVLDIACGSGRHLGALREAGLNAMGIDLSRELLNDCRQKGFPVVRGNMLQLPFASQVAQLMGCFFTSFGYFDDPQDDQRTLGEFQRVLKPGGFLFLDLMNPSKLRQTLVPEDHQESKAMHVTQRRKIEGGLVIKEISILHADGKREFHSESVRLYEREEIEEKLTQIGFAVEAIFGNERGDRFEPNQSNRMSLLVQKKRL